jgi:hypothetical protein
LSYNTIWTSVADQALSGRITAAVAQETPTGTDVAATFLRVQWPVLTATDVEAAYASALAADNPNPGGDEAVITDGMVLSHVQAALAELPELPQLGGQPSPP